MACAAILTVRDTIVPKETRNSSFGSNATSPALGLEAEARLANQAPRFGPKRLILAR